MCTGANQFTLSFQNAMSTQQEVFYCDVRDNYEFYFFSRMDDSPIMRKVTYVDICAGTFQNMLCCSLPAHENIFFRILRQCYTKIYLLIHRGELESVNY